MYYLDVLDLQHVREHGVLQQEEGDHGIQQHVGENEVEVHEQEHGLGHVVLVLMGGWIL